MSYPAFEDALKCGDQEALLRLYDAAIAQRDRAEAVLRSLLNPQTSTQTIGAQGANVATGYAWVTADADSPSRPRPPKPKPNPKPDVVPAILDLESI